VGPRSCNPRLARDMSARSGQDASGSIATGAGSPHKYRTGLYGLSPLCAVKPVRSPHHGRSQRTWCRAGARTIRVRAVFTDGRQRTQGRLAGPSEHCGSGDHRQRRRALGLAGHRGRWPKTCHCVRRNGRDSTVPAARARSPSRTPTSLVQRQLTAPPLAVNQPPPQVAPRWQFRK
jgi:hypothetical protein